MTAHSLTVYGVLALSIVVFALLLHATGALARAGRVGAMARDSVATMRSAALSDLEKEVLIRRASGAMLGLAVSLLARAGLALAGAVAVVGLGVAVHLTAADEVMAAAEDTVFLVVSGLAMVAALIVMR
jgi:hypothetical protein